MNQQYPILTDNYGQTYTLNNSVIKIGAGDDCQVRLDEPEVLEVHAEIRADGPNWLLFGLGDVNDLSINNQALQDPQQLHDGDVISLGNTILRFNAGLAEKPEKVSHTVAADLSGFRSSGEIQSIGISSSPESTETTSAAKQKKCKICGQLIYEEAEICPHCGVRQTEAPMPSVKQHRYNRTSAAILAILLGSFGAHKFYLGKAGLGLLYFIFFWTWIPGIVGFIEGFYYLTMSDEQFAEKFE